VLDELSIWRPISLNVWRKKHIGTSTLKGSQLACSLGRPLLEFPHHDINHERGGRK